MGEDGTKYESKNKQCDGYKLSKWKKQGSRCNPYGECKDSRRFFGGDGKEYIATNYRIRDDMSIDCDMEIPASCQCIQNKAKGDNDTAQ